MDTNVKNRISGIFLLFPAYIFGLIFDYFYGEFWGISYLILTAITFGIFLALLSNKKKLEVNSKWLLIFPTFILSISFAITSNEVLRTINHILAPLLLISSMIAINNNRLKINTPKFLITLFEKIGETLQFIFKPYQDLQSSLTISSGLKSNTKKILTAIVITTPLLIILITLLSSADLIFNNSVETFFSKFKDLKGADGIIKHIALIILSSSVFAGLIYSVIHIEKSHNSEEKSATRKWDPLISSFAITAVNIIYIIFTAIQFKYLFGGQANIQDLDITYADYARKGFFELITVTIINFIIVLSITYLTKKEQRNFNYYIKAQKIILLLATFVLVASAHMRLGLYEEAYGYTQARVFAHAAILALLILSFQLFYKVSINIKASFIKSGIITILSIYSLINLINIDGQIAKKNIERLSETGKIDIAYFYELSYDALPEISKIKDSELKENIKVSNLRKFKTEASQKLKEIEENKKWYSYNLSIENAINSIDQ